MNQEERTSESADSTHLTGRTARMAALRLRHERERHGWSQSELAERIGTNQVTVSRWEHDASLPSPYFRQKLSEAFGKTLEELGLFVSGEEGEEAARPDPSVLPVAPASDPVRLPEQIHAPLWNVPYRRNGYFTGREGILSQVHATLNSSRAVALTQTQAISGLGGIGKTQVAVEYAYRYGHEYIAVLWITASGRERFIADFIMLAALFELPEKDQQDQNIVQLAVKRWFTNHAGWLLILDNVDELETIEDMLPRYGNGSILLTTRLQAVGSLAQGISVDKMERNEGILFLLRRTKLLAPQETLEQATPEKVDKAAEIVAELGALPLALDQAGAYIEETRCGLAAYHKLYRTRQRELLYRRGILPTDHPDPVATTWSLSFEEIERKSVAAADLLRLLAFLSPEAIPEEILTDGAAELSQELGTAVKDPLQLNEIIVLLLRYSLVRRSAEDRSLSIHRLVQAVLRDGMSRREKNGNSDLLARVWAERAIRAINRIFPDVQPDTWEQCLRCLPHVLESAHYLDDYDLVFPEAADLLMKAAAYQVDHSQFAAAEPLLTKALDIRQQISEATHLDMALLYNNLGELYLRQWKYQQAEPLLQQALVIRQQELGEDDPNTATSLNNLARLYQTRGSYDQAESLYQQVYQVRKLSLHPGHPDIARSLNHLAGIYADQGKYAEAEVLYVQALDMQKNIPTPDQLDISHTLNSLALVCRKQGAYDRAEELYKEALRIQRNMLNPDHADIATTLNNLAGLYRAQGLYSEAELIYQEALGIREQVFGPDHPLVAQSLYYLMKLYHSQGRYHEAEASGIQALHFQEQQLGRHHPDIAFTLSMLARIYQGNKQLHKAEAFYQRARDIRESTTGVNHPHMALILNNLAEIYQTRGDYDRAGRLIEQSMAIRERALGRDHLYMAYSLINLAENMFMQGEIDQAEQLFKQAIANREHNLGVEHPRTASAYHSLAKFYSQTERYEEAEALYKQALGIREQALGAEHPAVVTSLEDYARFLRKTGQSNQAIKHEKRAEALRKKLSKPP